VQEGQGPRRVSLSFFDLVNLVVGAVIGADVYIVTGPGAARLGPALLVAWIVGGVLAGCISLCFAQCAAIVTTAGGPYAYVEAALGRWPARFVGWALYLAEWAALPVFPVAAIPYVATLVHLDPRGEAAFKIAFIAFFLITNLIGVRTAGRVNDVLTVGKLLPLAVLVATALVLLTRSPGLGAARLTPFAPFGWGRFDVALILVFWAYAGFEVASLPSEAIADPRVTLPRAILLGMAIATAFYLLTNLAAFLAVPWPEMTRAPAPLARALGAALEDVGLPPVLGVILMTAGAVVSIAGVNEAVMLGASQLAARLAAREDLPAFLAHQNRAFGTPDLALLAQAASALIAAVLLDLTRLIEIAVFFLVLVYLATVIAAALLVRRYPERRLRVPALSAFIALAALGTALLGGSIKGHSIILGVGLLTAVGSGSTACRLLRPARSGTRGRS